MNIEENENFLLNPGILLKTSKKKDIPKISIIQKGIEELACTINKHKQTKFIGGHPISLTHNNLTNKICKPPEDFVICEKSDGLNFIKVLFYFISSIYFHFYFMKKKKYF